MITHQVLVIPLPAVSGGTVIQRSMSSTDLVQEWLQGVLRPFPSRERITTEILEVLTRRRTLSVKTDAFSQSMFNRRYAKVTISSCMFLAFDSGQTALLLLLHGTLPIIYKGSTYQIPLNIWIPFSYPREPPITFVVPTKEMAIRKGREVEPGGRVREEVVEEWWRSWQVG